MKATESNRTTVVIIAVILAGVLDFLANWLAAHYLVTVATFLIPGGTFVFALAFVVYDYLRRFHGIAPTVCAIALGFAASIAYSLVWGGGVGRIAAAGLIALACSSATDLATQTLILRWPIWRYVLAANGVSLIVDSLVFTLIAFSALPLSVQWHIMEGQYLAKLAMTVVAIPLVYGARRGMTAVHDPTRAAA